MSRFENDPKAILNAPVRSIATLLLTLLGGLVSCGPIDVDDSSPQVLEIDQQEVVLGESLYLYGVNFSEEDYQDNIIHFSGQFTDDLGRSEPVDVSVRPIIDGEVERGGRVVQVLRVTRFGPFRNPFGSSGRPGRFVGDVVSIIADDNGAEVVGVSRQPLSLEVGPSIEITELQPLFADCGAPAIRALEGIGYRLGVRAVGIAPIRFEYELSRVNGVTGVTSFEHTFSSPVEDDFVGEAEPLFFNPVEDGQQFYISEIRIKAFDAEGQMVETAIPLSVHRPLEVVYDGKREVAERYEPAPVSGCIPGSIETRVNYSETKSEYRQQTVSVTINQNWLRSSGQNLSRSWREGVSEGQTQSRTLGSSLSEEETIGESMSVSYNQSEANNVNFSNSDGESWQWSMSEGESNSEYLDRMNDIYGSGSWQTSVKATAEGSVPFLAKASGSVGVSTGVKVGGRSGETMGSSVSTRRERGYSTSGSTNEQRSFGSTTSETRGQNINNSYALSSSTSQSLSESDSLSSNRTWNLSESTSESEVISESESTAQNLTVSSSQSDSITQSFSGFIPRGRFGIFYRQTTRWVRRAEVRTYNQCGLAQHVGELLFNEFTWAPDLAISSSCEDRAPPPNLPSKTCIIPPCSG
jgi:hypothetical protein